MEPDPVETINIRPARDGEHVALTALVIRSVEGTWDYPDEFMAWNLEDIIIEPEHIRDMITNVVEVDGRVAGVYVLRGGAPEMELSRMMVDAGSTGRGLGRLLWEHAVETAKQFGVGELKIDSDPNAEGFYLRMGAVTIGEFDWSPPMMPGWHVKTMKYRIP
jgi:GNAT superfamily N-acetyltransferase